MLDNEPESQRLKAGGCHVTVAAGCPAGDWPWLVRSAPAPAPATASASGELAPTEEGGRNPGETRWPLPLRSTRSWAFAARKPASDSALSAGRMSTRAEKRLFRMVMVDILLELVTVGELAPVSSNDAFMALVLSFGLYPSPAVKSSFSREAALCAGLPGPAAPGAIDMRR